MLLLRATCDIRNAVFGSMQGCSEFRFIVEGGGWTSGNFCLMTLPLPFQTPQQPHPLPVSIIKGHIAMEGRVP